MSIRSIEISKKLKSYGKILGRRGISDRTIEIAQDIIKTDDPKEIIKLLGQMYALALSCGHDEYWREKRDIGFDREYFRGIDMINAKTKTN